MTERPKRENWKDSPPKNWAEREAYRLSRVILDLREGRSMQWLSDRTEELGHRVSRSVLSDLETGRRRYLTTVEMTMISAALNVSPVTLLYPGPYDATVELIPHVEVTELRAAEWFSGNGFYRGDIGEGVEAERAWADVEAWVKSRSKLQSWRDLETTEVFRSSLMKRGADFDLIREQVEFYDNRIKQIKIDLGISDDG
ncbi:Conserved protein of uncharacterised function%2C possible DNA binding protein [Mycobacteroides abscessus]|uniref:Conserved protein of uncharacterized function, possible DNA binding protein n=1 Tax=Mycobacteroides abscessus subsp. massiliense TaxID=1962118 RepID=A0AB38DBC8_9MYCO|nr:hypothetical protein [Mycobacteroides abscessus]AMU28040.1 hypothetical protein A3N96_23705 [Mycobacteroides abscessus]AMU37668.1 hypothetical protein A3N98_22585 [Mycobacteroides abscessus]AMU42714.1 hypothetical protein A3N99_23180 [Mycobacteroides abscessus]AMU62686.1 hypothetical protein A3O03_23295 [Mycobacteroides abscessus]MBN7344726.1 hypothetical protein [Mycobacteroides abscessus subsp. massiliense]